MHGYPDLCKVNTYACAGGPTDDRRGANKLLCFVRASPQNVLRGSTGWSTATAAVPLRGAAAVQCVE